MIELMKITNHKNIQKSSLLTFGFLLLLLIIPIITSNDYILMIFIWANIYAVYAASWDLLAGVTGQFSFGHALFLGVAGYIAGFLNLFFGLPPPITIPAGGIFGVLVGLIVGVPSLRLKGPYFRIASLTFPLILAGIIIMYPQIPGGDEGLWGVASISSDVIITYYLSILLMATSIFTLMKILTSKFGLIFRSIRDDEDLVEASGINTVKYKLISFAISGFFAGLAGGFQTHLLSGVEPNIFNPYYSFQAILYTGLGGIGTIIGSLGGSYLMIGINEILRDLIEFRVLIYAIIMVLIFRFLPMGLIKRIITHLKIPIGIWSGLNKRRRTNKNDNT